MCEEMFDSSELAKKEPIVIEINTEPEPSSNSNNNNNSSSSNTSDSNKPENCDNDKFSYLLFQYQMELRRRSAARSFRRSKTKLSLTEELLALNLKYLNKLQKSDISILGREVIYKRKLEQQMKRYKMLALQKRERVHLD